VWMFTVAAARTDGNHSWRAGVFVERDGEKASL
jgi:hypothetical protein